LSPPPPRAPFLSLLFWRLFNIDVGVPNFYTFAHVSYCVCSLPEDEGDLSGAGPVAIRKQNLTNCSGDQLVSWIGVPLVAVKVLSQALQ